MFTFPTNRAQHRLEGDHVVEQQRDGTVPFELHLHHRVLRLVSAALAAYRNVASREHDGLVERGRLRPEREHLGARREREVAGGEGRLGVGERVVDDVLVVHAELLRVLEVLFAVDHCVGEVKERSFEGREKERKKKKDGYSPLSICFTFTMIQVPFTYATAYDEIEKKTVVQESPP